MTKNQWRGFSLVELLTVLAIAAILTIMAVPGYNALIQNNKIVSAANKLSASLNFARMEAVKRGVRVAVCPTANAGFTACGNNTQWSQGWIIFIDSDNNNAIETTNDLVKVAQPLPNDAAITTSSNVISYDGSGFLTSGTSSLSLRMTRCTGNNARVINVASSGRVSVSMAACN
ncbi:GspH/FimT family pseudopilin [Legionella oakridgensis]|uniref:Type II secretion system protein H n=2 Tax=Legionella oakridgensis TaxID=29423 RepID=W0BFF1_9GAMM|nr:GspH/FimT family pseudopilin [Legionella oakridgensis]AHE67332.1 prepilin-type N-terminal cleavage/methylation domain protein [Legionella oakridgensis ATCC 33761 = DSM 21215]ETO93082.1 prepilin-type N-terminal cleavage/methylation domain protein [Legionella oakridgensis RV-2-2007]KTD37882.1 type IV pre-pilin [Legionella oakridgensis]STY20396.1 type IV pre-pilin [Legionella longbeachae]